MTYTCFIQWPALRSQSFTCHPTATPVVNILHEDLSVKSKLIHRGPKFHRRVSGEASVPLMEWTGSRQCSLRTLHAQESLTSAVLDLASTDTGENPNGENTSQFLLIPAKIMFWPHCLERKVWNDPFFWLYNLHKSLKEASQGNFPWNISSRGGQWASEQGPLAIALPAAHHSTVRSSRP